jgi:hypothetical protein
LEELDSLVCKAGNNLIFFHTAGLAGINKLFIMRDLKTDQI